MSCFNKTYTINKIQYNIVNYQGEFITSSCWPFKILKVHSAGFWKSSNPTHI